MHVWDSLPIPYRVSLPTSRGCRDGRTGVRLYAFEVITNFLFSTGFQLLKLCWLRSERRGHANAAMKTLDSKFHLQFILVFTVGRKTSLKNPVESLQYIFFLSFYSTRPPPPPPHPRKFQENDYPHCRILNGFLCFFCFLQLDYIVFLALFSYVILVRQATTPSNVETVVILFVCSLFTEEIRQVRQVHRGEVILGWSPNVYVQPNVKTTTGTAKANAWHAILTNAPAAAAANHNINEDYWNTSSEINKLSFFKILCGASGLGLLYCYINLN